MLRSAKAPSNPSSSRSAPSSNAPCSRWSAASTTRRRVRAPLVPTIRLPARTTTTARFLLQSLPTMSQPKRKTTMTRLAKTLITATAMLTLMSASAFADGSNDGGVSNILNGQVNLNNQTATLNLSSTNVQGNISGGATAGGNAIDITTMNNTNVINNQYVSTQNIDADVYANLTNVGGTTDLNSQSVCNQDSISMD